MNLIFQALALTFSCLAVLALLFSNSNKGKIYPLFMGALWVIVLFSAVASWTAVAGRVSPGVVHEITGWYWWLLPAFCSYLCYENYKKAPFTEKQAMRFRFVGAVVIGAVLIVLGFVFWPHQAPEVVKPAPVVVTVLSAAEKALDSLNKIRP